MQSIVIVQGLEHLGPLCLSLAGHAQMSFCGESGYEQSGALALHRRIVVQKANEVTRRRPQRRGRQEMGSLRFLVDRGSGNGCQRRS